MQSCHLIQIARIRYHMIVDNFVVILSCQVDFIQMIAQFASLLYLQFHFIYNCSRIYYYMNRMLMSPHKYVLF